MELRQRIAAGELRDWVYSAEQHAMSDQWCGGSFALFLGLRWGGVVGDGSVGWKTSKVTATTAERM
jgi:hypothetical protein